MNKTCYIDVKPEVVTQVVENMLKNKDSVLVMPVIKDIENISPNKRKPYHLMKLKLVFPKGSIVTPTALSDFGLVVITRIPKELVNSKYLEKKDCDTCKYYPRDSMKSSCAECFDENGILSKWETLV